VVIPVRNAADEIGALLDALRRQNLPCSTTQIVIVDDASADATAANARASGLAEVVQSPTRLGSYGARNAGIAVAQADTLAFTDGDCLPTPSWLERGLHALAERRVDVLAGHVDMPLGLRPPKAAVVDAALHMNQRLWVESHEFGATANLFVRRELFDRIGLFDGRLRSGGDMEFCHRAVAAGFRLGYTPDAVIVHEPRRAGQLVKKAYRIGSAPARQARPTETKDSITPVWARPKQWLPARRPFAEGSLADRHYYPKPGELVVLRLVHWLCYRLPRAAGSLVAAVSARRREHG